MKRGGAAAIAHAGSFFMKEDRVTQTLHAIAKKMDELGIPYAVAGGMALAAHGFVRTTVDVDLLVSAEGLSAVHHALERLGYVPHDRIVDFASPDAFRPQATDLPEVAEHFQGGPFCTWGHDGVLRRR